MKSGRTQHLDAAEIKQAVLIRAYEIRKASGKQDGDLIDFLNRAEVFFEYAAASPGSSSPPVLSGVQISCQD